MPEREKTDSMNRSQKRQIILEQFPVLFHGTDARILDMSEEERHAFHSDCESVSNALWSLFEPNALGQETVMDRDSSGNEVLVERDRIDRFRERFEDEGKFRRFVLAVSIFYRSHFLDDTLFEHDAVYLTSFRQGAERYAVRAGHFGEIGFVAYHLADAAKRCGFRPDCDSLAAKIERIIRFSEAPHYPVVIEVSQYNPDELLGERGEPVSFSRGKVRGCMFRYRGEMDLRTFRAIPVKETSDF